MPAEAIGRKDSKKKIKIVDNNAWDNGKIDSQDEPQPHSLPISICPGLGKPRRQTEARQD
jgi:hypothetical protein